jgi:hypothetical protein
MPDIDSRVREASPSATIDPRFGQSRPWGVGTPSSRRSGRVSRPGGRRTCPGFCLKAAAPCATCRVPNTRLISRVAPLSQTGTRSWQTNRNVKFKNCWTSCARTGRLDLAQQSSRILCFLPSQNYR